MLDSVVNGIGSAAEPWGYLLLFVLCLLEASAFIGLLVPGETALLVAGVLASEGKLSLPLCIVSGVAGAVIGDSVGYEIGRRLGPRLRSSQAGQRLGHERWDRAHRFVHERGPQAVFFGRWVGVLRALVPAIVGDARMAYRKFLLWNVLGAIASSPVVILLGYAAGSSYRSVERRLHWIAYVLVAVAATAIIVRQGVLHRHGGADRPDPTDRAAARPSQTKRRRPGATRTPDDLTLIVMYTVFLGCTLGLVVSLFVWR